MLAANEEIGWHPEHIKHGRFGKWLEGNVDWALSRDRYWGTPLPIWECDAEDCDERFCAGSIAELREKGGRGPGGPPPPLHRRGRIRLRARRLQRHDAQGPLGDRHLVRLGLDAVGAVPLPLREPGAVRGAIPRRLHLRGHRPDPRLVLHPARRGGPALRHLELPQRGLPRPDPRPRGPEDVEEPRQRGRALGRDRAPRRRRLPLVLLRLPAALVGVPVLGGHGRRGGPPLPPHPLEHLLVLGHLRQRLRAGDRRAALRAQVDRRRVDPRSPSSTAGRSPGCSARSPRSASRWTAFDCTAAARAIAGYTEELSNWYVRLSRRRFWDGRPGGARDPSLLPRRDRQDARPLHPVHRRGDLRQPSLRPGDRPGRSPWTSGRTRRRTQSTSATSPRSASS